MFFILINSVTNYSKYYFYKVWLVFKILIIDDIDKSIINSDYKSKLLSEALCNFEKIVITSSNEIIYDTKSFIPINKTRISEFSDYGIFKPINNIGY